MAWIITVMLPKKKIKKACGCEDVEVYSVDRWNTDQSDCH